MAINQSKYVNIVSGVGAATIVPERQLIGRLFTDNDLLPPQSFLEFSSAAAVGVYFGTTSNEYLRALYYFSFVSKNITTPQTISFGRWVDTAVAPMIFGVQGNYVVGTFSTITTGTMGLTINGVSLPLSGIDFSADVSLAEVAATLQTAIRTGSGSEFTSATVTYDATNKRFDFVGGSAIAATISVQPGIGGVDITPLIGWVTTANGSPIIAPGSAVETLTETLTTSSDLSNNFGSFAFMTTTPLTLSQNIEAANWNNLQNVLYQFQVPVTSANAAAWAATDGTGLGLIGGTGLTLSNTAGEYPEMLPMMILAATNYNAVNSVQNYEFQQSTLTPSVTSDAVSAAMDALRVNYYGQTQTAGQLISFYQQGVLMGIATDPLDMNTYANEQWLKDAAAAAVLGLLLALSKVSANTQGVSQILGILQSVINQAVTNGTISVNKALTTTQQLFIAQVTGDSNAWYQVQTIGYWINCVVVATGTNPVIYTLKYTLVYSKDDIIRMVNGTHDLI